MSLIANNIYRFGSYELDADSVLLRNGEEVIALPPKAFDLLSALVAARGEVVTKEQLLQSVWPDSFVEEGNLSQGIFVLRRKLGLTSDGQDYIQTVPRRGYRFSAPIERVARDQDIIAPRAITTELALSDEAPQTYAQKATTKRKRTDWLVWVVPLCIGIVAGLLAVVLLRSMKTSDALGSYVQLTQDGIDKRGRTEATAGPIAALASDGTRVYFTEGSSETSRLMQVSVSGGETAAIPVPFLRPQLFDYARSRSELLVGGFESPAAPAKLWAVPVPAGVPHKIGDVEARDASWSPDGKEIVCVSGTDLSIVQATGEGKHRIASLPGSGWRPKFSPDGNAIRLTIVDSETGDSSLWELATDGSNLHKLLPDWTGPHEECCGTWRPDGRFIFQATRDGRTELWSLPEPGLWQHLLRITELPTQVTAGPGDMLAPASGASSDRIYALGQQLRGELVRFNKVSGKFESYLDGNSMDFLSFTRDGKWLIYVAYPQGTLWRSKADGSERLQLTFAPMRAMVPHWSPDGNTIVFYGYGDGRRLRVYSIARDGGVPQPITERGNEMNPSWSQDGTQIFFSDFPFFGLRLKEISIHAVSRVTGTITDIPGSTGFISPEASPDGKHLAAVTLIGHRIELFDFQTVRWTDLVEGSGLLKWSHDGNWIYYTRTEGDAAIMRIRLRDRKVEQVVDLTGFRQGGRLPGLQFSLAPDDSPVLLKDTGLQEIFSVGGTSNNNKHN